MTTVSPTTSAGRTPDMIAYAFTRRSKRKICRIILQNVPNAAHRQVQRIHDA